MHSLPHVRGGVSKHPDFADGIYQSSPRAWGCFFLRCHTEERAAVFPTCVGVFPSSTRAGLLSESLPHVRGGVSEAGGLDSPEAESSPRAWGCFSQYRRDDRRAYVFPTCVGVFLTRSPSRWSRRGLPHVRGGVSFHFQGKAFPEKSSPRAWGCFSFGCGVHFIPLVFPTCVGVFPLDLPNISAYPSLPHVRGGVSSRNSEKGGFVMSSPRAWGCFRRAPSARQRMEVFPTCVGVFPAPEALRLLSRRLPHVRGGVSSLMVCRFYCGASSPRAWGCFSGQLPRVA